MAANVRRSGGNFHDKKLNVKEISFSDWQNPWNFYGLFSKSDDVVLEWLRDNGLLARTVPCHKCDGSMFLKSKADIIGVEDRYSGAVRTVCIRSLCGDFLCLR